MINLPGKIRAPLDELAKKGQYSQMDFSAAKDVAGANVVDVVDRFRFSKMFLEEIARGL